jgi:hypothetical protein
MAAPDADANGLAECAQWYLDITPHVHFKAADQVHVSTGPTGTTSDIALSTILQKLEEIHIGQQTPDIPRSMYNTPTRSPRPQRRQAREDRRSQCPSHPR